MATSNQNIFGYIPTESVDWSKAIGGLYTTVKGIEEGREELKLELDQLKTDNIKTIQQADKPSQTYGQPCQQPPTCRKSERSCRRFA